jgi:hypothetical protein
VSGDTSVAVAFSHLLLPDLAIAVDSDWTEHGARAALHSVARGCIPLQGGAFWIIGVRIEPRGSSMEHIVKCTVFLADFKEWPAFNEVYREYFKTNPPARSALAVSGLALNARTEIECIAFVHPAPR